MPGGQHESVAVVPLRVGRVVLEVPADQMVHAIGAQPIGMPGCPDRACSTMSAASRRIVVTARASRSTCSGASSPAMTWPGSESGVP